VHHVSTPIIKVRLPRLLNRLRRPAFLLSGLLTCGCCGGNYAIIVNDRYGCLGHFRKGTCDYGRTIRRDGIERRPAAPGGGAIFVNRRNPRRPICICSSSFGALWREFIR
jgi:hypothetical protein